jgi:hypothetical protein
MMQEQRWVRWAPYAAAIWSLGYGVLGVLWAWGVRGYPFGPDTETGLAVSLLAGLDRGTGAWVIAGVGVAGAALAITMARTRRPTGRTGRWVPPAVAGVLAGFLAVVLPDYRVLATIAYTPILVLGAPFGYPPGVGLADAYPWPVVNQMLCMAGGILWGLAGLAYARRQRAGCPACGRTVSAPLVARWGRRAVAVAVAIPVFYAVTRWAWALGVPLGISSELLDQLGDGVWSGAALGTLAIGGAILTLGLVQRWGEVFPRWLPGLAGRRVPPMLAVVPAMVVALLVTSAGLMFLRLWLTGGLSAFDGNWAALAPELLWPVWGLGLAAAALAYWLRRGEPCRQCQVEERVAERVAA